MSAVLSLLLPAVATSAGCYTGLDGNRGAGGFGDGSGADDAGDGDGGDGPGSHELCAEPQVGPTGLRRLTAEQYDNTVRDLLGVTTLPSVQFSFAPDERVGPFTSNGTAPVVDLQVEQYMAAAEGIAAEVVGDLAGILPCDPGAMGEQACAEEFITTLGMRAYRRPLDASELSRLMGVYEEGRSHGDFSDGVRLAIQGVLQSPFFLYHTEQGEAGDDGDLVALDGHAVASRLSYFLWNTMPDDALFAAAASGGLDSSSGLEAQLDRMLADPKAEEAIASFHLQWLGADEIAHLEKDSSVYPAFHAGLASAMLEETSRFTSWVLREGDATLDTLFTAEFTFTDDPELLALYGVTLPDGHVPGDPVPLPEGQRAGLLTHASLMASHAHANQTSPIHRGVLVRENLFCQMLPPPPPDVDDVPPDPDPNATTRERFAQHTADPSCAGCHNLIDPLGFGLENYDSIGAFRTMEGDLPVDASGELIATDIDGPFDGAVELAGRLVQSQQVRQCVAQQWFRFALGRGDAEEDACTMERLYDSFESSGNDVRVLLRELVLSDAFRYRRSLTTGEEI
jgi:hypothetical protein